MRAITDSFVAVFRRMCMEKSLCFAFLLLSLAACGHQDNEEREISENYETMTVRRSDITLEQTSPASIEGRQSIRIIPQVEGYLPEIRIKEGQRVRKGQVLFVIDQATFRAEEKAAKAQLQQAEAQLESARSNLSYTVLTSPSDGVAWTPSASCA